jgi:hypothetical protein
LGFGFIGDGEDAEIAGGLGGAALGTFNFTVATHRFDEFFEAVVAGFAGVFVDGHFHIIRDGLPDVHPELRGGDFR